MRITEPDPRTGRSRYARVPIFVRYQRILDLEKKMPKEKWEEYKAELFGTATEVFSAEVYDEIEIIKNLKVDFARWEQYDIDLQARLIAQIQLATVVEIVRKHDQLQEQARKRIAQKSAQKAQQAASSKKSKRAATKTRFSK